VPEGVSSLSIVAVGERGESRGGFGARLSGELAVSPGQVFYVHAAEENGGSGGRYAGGSSSIATGPTPTPEDLIAVAAGGGGNAEGEIAWRGGNAGEPGEADEEPQAGLPGNSTGGGQGGADCEASHRAESGSFLRGGQGDAGKGSKARAAHRSP
jgi:hypothetical protein